MRSLNNHLKRFLNDQLNKNFIYFDIYCYIGERKMRRFSNRLYYCSLCSFVATSYEELDLHYSLAHDDVFDNDLSYELSMKWNEVKKKKKSKRRKQYNS